MVSLYNPEEEPDKAALLEALYATGEYVDVSISCSICKGAFTALAKRDMVPSLSRACAFCGSEDTSVTVLDWREA